ncbi:MAG TPA: hypothetical protein VGP38_08150 [Rubrobacter sp.]|nr:hypothetical protein [Rubrobacter sp.]
MREPVFKEPEGSRRAWVFVLIGCYFFVETIFFREGLFDRLLYLIFGVAVLGFGVADLLPRDQTRLAGLLRIGGLALMVLTLLVRVVQLIT